MPQTVWEINFDVRALLAANYLGLYSEEDEEVWERWAKWVGYRRDSLKELVITKEVRHSLRARAVLARVLPPEYLPFCWEEPHEEWQPFEFHHESVPEVLQRLKYDVLCGFMEALPRSLLFDLSDHPVVRHLPRLNEQVIGYLVPPKNSTPWAWLDKERAFSCYRLQSQMPDSWRGCEWHFGAFFELLCHGGEKPDEHWTYWNERADARMKGLIERELAGDIECTGTLAGYASTVLSWIESTHEAPEPYDMELAFRQMEYILDHDPTLEEDLHLSILIEYICYRGSSRPDLVEKGGRHYLIGPSDLSSGEKRSRYWPGLVNIAKAVTKYSKDPALLAAAGDILTEEEEIQQPVREKNEARRRAKTRQDAEARHLLEEMM